MLNLAARGHYQYAGCHPALLLYRSMFIVLCHLMDESVWDFESPDEWAFLKRMGVWWGCSSGWCGGGWSKPEYWRVVGGRGGEWLLANPKVVVNCVYYKLSWVSNRGGRFIIVDGFYIVLFSALGQTLCASPVFVVHSWSFWCFCNPSNSHMDYRIFNMHACIYVCVWSFLPVIFYKGDQVYSLVQGTIVNLHSILATANSWGGHEAHVCHDKSFVTTKHVFCHNKSMLVVTKVFSWKNYVVTKLVMTDICCDKHNFVTTNHVFWSWQKCACRD